MPLFEAAASALLAPLFWLGAGTPAAAPAAPSSATCPAGMRLVEGWHYEQLQRVCRRLRHSKCYEFVPGLLLKEPRVTAVSTCMDVYEWPNQAGAEPVVMMKFTEAEAACAAAGKRLCTEIEWELGCEGPWLKPWPYGYARLPGACNTEKPYRAYSQAKLISPDQRVRDQETRRLWQGAVSGSFPACVSDFGIADLVGNVEEWVITSRPEWPHRSSLKGGYWSKTHSFCRGTNERHSPSFRFYEIGFRCCQDPKDQGPRTKD